ncbi:hypothetical protein BATDEDRAFT_91168 [Batrachochytrium dendrobatidis JAM81]|uniref:Mediator of RNA polymerase II transcription subunit 6 n=2 Tax=Batrachochytrium dendrobatidis TaxID=109871 RepID=F4P9Y8_BATDJ|nr:uncharacterized protein BATDEDRAFT_91168 [Batrachochytrium dendrobatidis JAM81]EGF78057.1 hypothetical protein BATDEDRAFT_91168 [Batrachochytrium dendrobatidis JAM81]OAJ44187.1 hypothetical protein BDEG_27451 [Batrachochytrium dendrobatidis JEL423]|eukprot:XP_006681567.1 hypothetical protein BATDEDRAFT_91168 [Batrachochytrium dendrobatidis JAM81]
MEQEDLTTMSFKDTAFLQLLGLNEHNALDYFSMSQFYDKSCLNEQLKMQVRHNELQAQQLDGRQMKGLEYTLWYFTPQPSLYVIRKQTRLSPTRVDLVAVYYIVEGTIYQSPTLCQVLANRVRTSLYFTKDALHVARESYRYNPILGHTWSNEPDLFEQLQTSLEKKQQLRSNATISDTACSSDMDMDVSKPCADELTSTANVVSLDEQHRAEIFSMTVDQLIASTETWSANAPPVSTSMDNKPETISRIHTRHTNDSPLATMEIKKEHSSPGIAKVASQQSKTSSGKRMSIQ